MTEGRRYKISAVLGQGGFGTVYAAELLGEGGFTRKVALKVLNADMEGIDDVANRLRDEARLLGLLRHRAIVQVDGLVMLDDRWTVVMEYIEGVDLQRLVRGAGPMPLGPALEVISEVASALDVAYMTPSPSGVPLRLLHRDIKPPNIVLTSAGETKVLDFGIARADFGEREAKTKSVLYGSIGYMAPERMEFVELPAGDVFALGTVLFELLDGNPLGKGSINPTKHKGHVDASVQRLIRKLGSCPPEFPELLTSMLAYDPDERPTAREVERRCRALRTAVGEPWLRDWAERAVPPVLARASSELRTDGMSGAILIERSGRAAPSATPSPSPARPPPPPPSAPRADATYAVGEPSVRVEPPRRGGILRTLLMLGCATVLIASLVVVVFGATATGGLLALLALGTGGAYDTGAFQAPVYEPAHVYEPAVDAPVAQNTSGNTTAGAAFNPWGVTATVMEPWKSWNLPIGDGVAVYCDETSIVVIDPSADTTAVGKRWTRGFEKKGWKKENEFAMQGNVSMTMTKGRDNVTLSIIPYEGTTMISAARY